MNLEEITMFEFKDQVVLVTGAGSPRGMGRVFAQTFAELAQRLCSAISIRRALTQM